MHRRPGIWIVGLLAVALGAAAAVGVHASSAAPTRAAIGATTLDRTYSCRVRKQHFINVGASVTLPPVQNQPQPGVISVTTVQKTIKQKTGVTVSVSQLGFSTKKNSLKVDTFYVPPRKAADPTEAEGALRPSHHGDADPVRARLRAVRDGSPRPDPAPAQDDGGSSDACAARDPQRQHEAPTDRVLRLEYA